MSTKKKDTTAQTNQDRPVMILEKKNKKPTGTDILPRSRPVRRKC